MKGIILGYIAPAQGQLIVEVCFLDEAGAVIDKQLLQLPKATITSTADLTVIAQAAVIAYANGAGYGMLPTDVLAATAPPK